MKGDRVASFPNGICPAAAVRVGRPERADAALEALHSGIFL